MALKVKAKEREVKRVTSADLGTIEDPESSLTPDPSPMGEGSENTGGNTNQGGGDDNGGGNGEAPDQ